jgi:hypothetical protein
MKIDITIPSGTHEMPLHIYQTFVEVVEEKGNDAHPDFEAEQMIELFCGISQDKIKLMTLDSFNSLKQHFITILQKKLPIQKEFTLNGVKFGMIPDLENISYGEYIDLEENIKHWSTMHKAMAVLYRPITETKKDKYLIESYEGSANYSEVMRYAPLSIALSSTVFFWDLGRELLLATIAFLEMEMKKLAKTSRWRDSSAESGDGIKASILLLKDDLNDLMPLHVFPYMNA